MEYHVELTARANADLEDIYTFISADSSAGASVWFNALERRLLSLATMPDRGSRPPEDASLRQVHHGRKPHTYRIIYKVDRSTNQVIVLHIRRGTRDRFTKSDLVA